MNKILITGATGNIGTELVKILSNANVQLKVMLQTTDASKEAALKQQGIEVVYGDFANQDSLNKALQGVDKLYLLLPSHPQMDGFANNAIAAAKHNGVKHIVKQSVLGADVNAPVEIPRLHGVADEALKNSGIAYTIIQPNAFMQNFIGFAATIKDHGALYANYGDGKFSTVDVRDIAASTAAALLNNGHENKIYAITGPEAIGAADFASALSAALGKEVKYVAVPDDAAKTAMLQMGMNEWFVDNLVGFGKIFAAGWAGYVSNDVETLTGKKPISIQQFAKDFAFLFQ